MTVWILAVLALWFAQVFYAASFKTVLADDPAAAMQDHVRGKDQPVTLSVHGARAQRAKQNLAESLPAFLALALLLEHQGVQDGLGVQGAVVFLVSRVLFVPAYHVAVPGLRSLMWTGGAVGLGMMVAASLG